MALRWLWARKRISSLSDHYWNKPEDNRNEIVSLGLKYSLLTPFTSFVAVDEIIRNPNIKAREVKQPLSMPAGVSNLAIGSRRNVPEPSLFVLASLLLIAVAVTKFTEKFRRNHGF